MTTLRNHLKIVIPAEQIDIQVTEAICLLHQISKLLLQLCCLFSAIDSLKKTQDGSDLSKADTVVMQKFRIVISYHTGFIFPCNVYIGTNNCCSTLFNRILRSKKNIRFCKIIFRLYP